MNNNDSENQGKSFDQRKYDIMQKLLTRTLLYGVLLSTGIIIAGLILMIVTNSTGYACDNSSDTLNCLLGYNPLAIPHGDYPNSLSSLAVGLSELKPFSIIQLGVVVLIATPVFRVFNSLVLFAIEHDKPFILITLTVLLILLFSFFIVPEIPFFKA